MRNKRRGPGVEESSIEKIITELENPLKTCCRHDRDTIRYSEGDTLEVRAAGKSDVWMWVFRQARFMFASLQALETRLRQIWTNYIPQAGSEPKVFLQRNWIHELDLLCRNIISETVHACKVSALTPHIQHMQLYCKLLVQSRELRRQRPAYISETASSFILSESKTVSKRVKENWRGACLPTFSLSVTT